MNNNIVKDYKLKMHFLKNEYKRLLYKSIMHNETNKPIVQSFIRYKLASWKIKTRISFQKRTCIVLGKNRSVYPKLNLKRHTIKKMNKTCLITGLSMGKW
jgi:ribosomal protein S14